MLGELAMIVILGRTIAHAVDFTVCDVVVKHGAQLESPHLEGITNEQRQHSYPVSMIMQPSNQSYHYDDIFHCLTR